ncbi:hypothetical protein R3P38DRAFT_3143517 [Favolaschia claudopus]|uniref:Uncharacterized protein n=1 Tax=Favolaschia claudopus TaxID=2862362 RepID=A0AAV9Z4L3_9AGAR
MNALRRGMLQRVLIEWCSFVSGSTTLWGVAVPHQVVMLGVAAYQRLDSRWDAKSEEFDPERWLDGRVRQGEAIGPYANLYTQLFAGPHTYIVCDLIGKFAFSTSENEDGPFRLRLATTLLPLNGERGERCESCV